MYKCKKRQKEYMRRWRKRHPGYMREYMRRYNSRSPQKAKQ